MKILELSLHAFGPFTDALLDLSGGQEGLHLVYGPNEAGKSSALRALKQALFGIPMQSADDFLHTYQKLRIGMTLRGGDGRELAFVRRKGTKNTLLAADGATPLPDAALATVLKGMTEAEFTFCCRRPGVGGRAAAAVWISNSKSGGELRADSSRKPDDSPKA